jgi:putative oxidoreductase
VRRLFSTFAHGAPGLGLLLLRIAAGLAIVFRAGAALRSSPTLGPPILYVLAVVVGLLLLVGLWTPVVGPVLAILASWAVWFHPAHVLSWILLATLGVALALLGPGGWSVDAHLFGWKRVELPDRKELARIPFRASSFTRMTLP